MALAGTRSCFYANSPQTLRPKPVRNVSSLQAGSATRRSVLTPASRENNRPPMTVRDQLRRTPEAEVARRKRDREDLYTDNWDGSEWKGSQVNVLNIILIVSVLTPLAGLGFAFWSYGRLWG